MFGDDDLRAEEEQRSEQLELPLDLGRPTRRSRNNWTLGRELYVGGYTLAECAALLGCHPKTVSRARVRYAWPARRPQHAAFMARWNRARREPVA